VAATSDVLTFALNGLSKIAGLPQVKLGWIVVNGPAGVLDEALARLEFAADLFLSVATPVQNALPALLAIAPEIRRQIAERVAANRAWLEARVGAESPCAVLPAEGGWYAVVRVPRVRAEEELALELLERENVLVQPGYFYDFAQDGLLVLSLLPPPDAFREGAGRVVAYVERLCAP
jgi:aspartate/methionine/tyrosine aminotransferase